MEQTKVEDLDSLQFGFNPMELSSKHIFRRQSFLPYPNPAFTWRIGMWSLDGILAALLCTSPDRCLLLDTPFLSFALTRSLFSSVFVLWNIEYCIYTAIIVVLVKEASPLYVFDKMTLRCIVLVTQATPLHVFAKMPNRCKLLTLPHILNCSIAPAVWV